MFRIDLTRENMKKPSCLKPQGLEPNIWYEENVCVWWGEGVGSCYGLKDYTTEETSLIALHQNKW